MSPATAPPRARKPARPKLGPQVLASLIAGASVDDIAKRESLSGKRVEKLLRDELRRRWVAPAQVYARLQIVRLEAILVKLTEQAEAGDFRAIDRILRVLDRLDRYHGFGRLTNPVKTYDEDARKRLLDKLDRSAGRLPAPPAKDPA